MTNKHQSIHQNELMRNMKNLVQDYVNLMGYKEFVEEVNRIMLMVDNADGKEKWRLTNIMLEATTSGCSSDPSADYDGIPHL
tara:strand:+ start:154 stop:399 length:246 start_codon:yes stop_codon:yes gene_type:complete